MRKYIIVFATKGKPGCAKTVKAASITQALAKFQHRNPSAKVKGIFYA